LIILVIIIPPTKGKAFNKGSDTQALAVTGMPTFLLQAGNPAYSRNFAHPDTGCSWMGVSGQIFGLDGKPLVDMIVRVGGLLNGKTLALTSRSGSAPSYGQGGYEIMITDEPIASQRNFLVGSL
jgi:hypothetical protein